MSERRLFQVLFIILCVAPSHAQESRWLPYAPTIVELHGKLLKVTKYGPPGYGENPKTDAKYQIPILLLAEPQRAKGDSTSPMNKEDLLNISFVQLIFLNVPPSEYWRHSDQNVTVTGTLFRAQTGYHYTDLLMEVREIRSAEKKIKTDRSDWSTGQRRPF